SLVLGGAVLWLLAGLSIGIISALRPRSLLDRTGMVFVLVGISAHPVWIGLLFAYFFGFKLGIFPITGYANFFGHTGSQAGPVQWAYHMILPWATFAILFAALYVRMIRANVMEALNEDYVRTARAKGASERLVTYRHALRNALIPVVSVVGFQVGTLMGGSVIIEVIFSLNGIGNTLVQAIFNRDYPLVQAAALFLAVVFVVVNTSVDLLYGYLDPRIKQA
ncbi:MAG: ABC transporter permease, partial [Chloroflexi bacterium]|nr:ABC transporter permease [Chloroflexota bacterium]